MSTLKNYDLRHIFKIEQILLLFVGYYPFTSTKYKLLYPLYLFSGFLTITIACCQFLSMLIQIIVDINDLFKVSETIFFFVTHTSYMCKMLNFLYYRNTMIEIEKILAHPLFYFPQNLMKILVTRVETGKKIILAYRIMCFVPVILYGFMPYLLLVKSNKRSLPLPGWQPYNSTVYYYQTASFQTISLCYTATINICFDTLFWVLVSLASGEFDILKENLRSLDYNNVEQEFINSVKHHQKIVKFVSKIEDTFSKGIFFNFFSSVLVFCFTGFMMFLVPFLSFQFIFLASYLSSIMTQTALYCWFGHDVLTTTEEIGRSFYMSNWYESKISLRKSMIIFLERTKRPVTLTGGKMLVLSLPTFTTILRSSYSYLAVLQQIYTD